MNTEGKRRESYITDRRRGKKREKEQRKKKTENNPRPSVHPHVYTYLSRRRPPLIRVKIDFFPLP